MGRNIKNVETLQELYNFIRVEKHVFEELINEENRCECCINEVYEDQDWNDFLESINTSEVSRKDGSIVLTDGNITISVRYAEFKNRHGYDLSDETVFYIDTMEII